MATTAAPLRATYLDSFDGLRFIAAAIVCLYHGEMFKGHNDMPTLPGTDLIAEAGPNAVTFFFCLSGFLITWLLLRERDGTGTVSLPAFYMRRVLRIWPVYYVVVVLGLFVLPGSGLIFMTGDADYNYSQLTWWHKGLFLTFFANLFKTGFFPYAYLIGHVWSIGLEEQFYAIWPVLVKYVRNWMAWAIGLVIVFFVARLVQTYLYPDNLRFLATIAAFRIDAMALGALAGWLFYRGAGLPGWLMQKSWLYVFGLAVLLGTVFGNAFRESAYAPILALLDTVFILMAALQPRALPFFEQPWMRRLGQMSYGIYMYHILCLMLTLSLLQRVGPRMGLQVNSLVWNLLYYIGYNGATLLVSYLSYHYMELPALQLKKRFGFDQRRTVRQEVEAVPVP